MLSTTSTPTTMEAVKQRMADLKDEAAKATERAEKADASLKVRTFGNVDFIPP